MRMAEKQRIAALTGKVWRARNDPNAPRLAIPGCQSLSRDALYKFRAAVGGKSCVRFNGLAALLTIYAPDGDAIAGEELGDVVGSVCRATHLLVQANLQGQPA